MGEGVDADVPPGIWASGLFGGGETGGCVGVGADAGGVATVWPNLLADVLAGLEAGPGGLSMGVNVEVGVGVGVGLTWVLPACVGETRSGPMPVGTAVGS